jgi:hypothetical protein
MLKKVLTWGLVIFLVYFVVHRPAAAAGVVHSVKTQIVDAGSGFTDFVTRVVS